MPGQRTLPFLPRLEALRGVAAVSVAGYHSVNDEVVTGMAPVVLFFVLSGFVLARSLEKNPDVSLFFARRIFRLWPPAAVAVVLMWLIYQYTGLYVGFLQSYDPVNVIMNAMLLRSYINGPSWSLTVEIVAAPVIVAAFFTCHRFGYRPLAIACAILFGLSFWGPYVHLIPGGPVNLGPMYAFIVGVTLHFALLEGRSIRFPIATAIVAVTVFVVCAVRKQTAVTIVIEVLTSATLIFVIAVEKRAAIFAVLDLPPLRFLGRISFSFYLLHMIGMTLAVQLVPRTASWLFVACVVCTIPLAWVSWRFIEVPIMRWSLLRPRQRDVTLNASQPALGSKIPGT